jgi:hypothetical protein
MCNNKILYVYTVFYLSLAYTDFLIYWGLDVRDWFN